LLFQEKSLPGSGKSLFAISTNFSGKHFENLESHGFEYGQWYLLDRSIPADEMNLKENIYKSVFLTSVLLLGEQ
jgi:hypothetical protein